MKASRIIALVSFLLSALATGLILTADMPLVERVSITQIVCLTVLLSGGTIMLLANLKRFTRKLRQVYALISASLVLVVAGTWQYAGLAIAGALNSDWMLWGGADLPFILSIICLYLGIRILAKLLDAQSALVKLSLAVLGAIAIAIVITILISLLGYAPTWLRRYQLVIYVFEVIMSIWLALLVATVTRTVSPFYRRAFTWLLWYCTIAVIGGFNTFVVLYLPSDHWYVVYNLGLLLYIGNGITIIMTALAFARVGVAEKTMMIQEKDSGAGKSKRSIDVVLLLASLASNPQAIDPILDPLRAITSNLGRSARLTPQLQTRMAEIYLKLEDYLINKEPIRNYKIEDLRQMVEIKFKNSVDEPTFWQHVVSAETKAFVDQPK